MADTTKIYENIFIKKNAAGDREYIKVPYAILADPPTIPDVSGFMPKSGGTFTGDVIIASGHHLKTDLIKSADDSKWIAEITGAGLEIGGSGTPLRFYSNTRPVVANQNKELAYTSDIPDISGKANLADGNTFGSQQTFEDITGTTTINGSYVAIQPTGAQGAYSFEVLNSNNTTAFSVIGDSSGSIKVGSPVSLGNNFGTSGQVLTSQGAGETPTWTTPAIKSVSLSGTTLTITL